MASTESPSAAQVERLASLDGDALAMLGELVVQSGWNQTGDDWRVFARHGSIGIIRDAAGRIVASGAVLPMGAALRGGSVAWISMILVHPSVRGRGLGRAVFDHCLRTAQAGGHVPMLDATPQGEPMYRGFGFEPVSHLTRWRREAAQAAAAPLDDDAPEIGLLAALDAQALGFRRAGLLGELAGRPGSRCVRGIAAIAVVRPGRIAHQIGPVLATDEGSAVAVVRRIADALPEPLMIDVPDESEALARALVDAGFARQRTFTRMALVGDGQSPPQGESALLHAIAGPEFA